MKIAYNKESIKNHFLIDDAITLHKSKIISDEQFEKIAETYKSGLYSPNFMIKILLFLGTTIAISGITGFLGLFFSQILEDAYQGLVIMYGLGLFVFANAILIKDKQHFRSGSLESILYHALTFFLVGLYTLVDFNVHFIFISLIVAAAFFTFYYLDFLSTISFPLIIGSYIFYLLQSAGGILEQLTPFILSVFFTLFYFVFNKLSKKNEYEINHTQFNLLKIISLLITYLSVNYLVVREMSIELMNLLLEPGNDIPFAYLFYFLTISIPIFYLWIGIKNKNKIFIRTGLILVALTVITFKYYYSTGHTEITLTISGAILLGISYYLLQSLKTSKNGYTREMLLTDKWADRNLEASIISQTLGGNTIDEKFTGNGGEFGGGGSTGSF